MTVHDLHEHPTVTVSPDRTQAAPTVHHDTEQQTVVATPVGRPELSSPQATLPRERTGNETALLVVRLLAAAALLVSAIIHAKVALDAGLGGSLFGEGQLFAAQALLSAVLAVALLTRDSRVWLAAVVLSVAGLAAILSSVYFPVPAVGPFPAIDEPVWLLNKAVCAVAEASVITLWLIRQIAPPK